MGATDAGGDTVAIAGAKLRVSKCPLRESILDLPSQPMMAGCSDLSRYVINRNCRMAS